MTREVAKREIESLDYYLQNHTNDYSEESHTAMVMAIKALEQEPCEDAISRQAVLELVADYDLSMGQVVKGIHALPSVNPQEPKTGRHCKDCKWWKDSDGAFKRGIGAESRCPINREEVYEGNGYCFMFEP